MADYSERSKSRSSKPAQRRKDGFPSNEELLHELRLHGAKPPPRELPAISRRTRDYLLVAGVGGTVIGVGVFRVLGGSESSFKLALIGIAAFCGLSTFIFYGVMNRY